MKHMKSIHLITTAAAAILANSQAQTITATAESEICSCSPIEYSFQLNFDGTCNDAAAPPPSDDDIISKGEDPVCFYTLGGSPGDDPPIRRKLAAKVVTGSKDNEISSPREGQVSWEERALSKLDVSSHVQHAQNFITGNRQQAKTQRRLQGFDAKPTVITSVSFLEFDLMVQDIINQDSTYFNTTLPNGEVLDFTSISNTLDPDVPIEDQSEFVPGGLMLIMFGLNAAEEVIQNTVAWSFNTDSCNSAGALEVTDNGWLLLNDFTAARPDFCPVVDFTTTAATEISVTTATELPPISTHDATITDATPEPEPATTTEATSSSGKSAKSTKATKSSKSSKSVAAAPVLDPKAHKGSSVSTKAEKMSVSSAKSEKSTVVEEESHEDSMGSKSAKTFGGAKSVKSEKKHVVDAKAEKGSKSTKAFKSSKGTKGSKASHSLDDGQTSGAHEPTPATVEEPTVVTRPPTSDAPGVPDLTPFPTGSTGDITPFPTASPPSDEEGAATESPVITESSDDTVTVDADIDANATGDISSAPTPSPLGAEELTLFPTIGNVDVDSVGRSQENVGDRIRDSVTDIDPTNTAAAESYLAANKKSAAAGLGGRSNAGGRILIALVLFGQFYWNF